MYTSIISLVQDGPLTHPFVQVRSWIDISWCRHVAQLCAIQADLYIRLFSNFCAARSAELRTSRIVVRPAPGPHTEHTVWANTVHVFSRYTIFLRKVSARASHSQLEPY